MPKILDYPPIWLLLCLVAVWLLGRVLPMPLWGRFGDVLGGMAVLLGLGLMALAVWGMAQARTTVIPRRAPDALVTAGIFRFSRNPIYLGDSLILVGFCLIWDVTLGLFLLPVFVWLINRRFIIGEEAVLEARFGKQYRDWRAAVRRWV